MRIPRFFSVFQFACTALAAGALIAQFSPGAMADTLHATDDAYIQTDNSDSNKGSDQKIKLKDDGGDDDRIGFGKFDLSTSDVHPKRGGTFGSLPLLLVKPGCAF